MVPDELVEVVGADRLVVRRPGRLRSGSRRFPGTGSSRSCCSWSVVEVAVVGVAAAGAGGQALQQGRDLAVARGEALVVGQPLRGPLEVSVA